MMTGTYERACAGEPPYLTFRYRVVRLWEVPVKDLLRGGPGLLPLAPVAAVQPDQLPAVVHEVKRRIDREVPADRATDLLAAAYVLMGLRYDASVVAALKREVVKMEESITYQEIVGIGQLKEARRLIVRTGIKRLGKRNRKVERRLESITDLEKLEALLDRVFEVNSWDELLPSR
jgi:hypothetical protein